MSWLRYWLCALIGIAISIAVVVTCAWATYELTRQSLCTPGEDRLGCELGGDKLAIVLAAALLVAMPIGSKLFARRTSPATGPLGLLTIGLSLCAAAGAALVVGVGSGVGTSAEAPGLIAGTILCVVAPIALLVGIASAFRNLDRSASQIKRAAQAQAAAAQTARPGAGGSGGAAFGVGTGGTGSGSVSAGAGASGPATATDSQFGDLAAQLSQIAGARARTAEDGLAAKLRQLDDMRASGLLTPEEHAAKRRALLDTI